MRDLKRMIPYIFILASAFFLLPLAGNSTGAFMLILLILMPLICFFTAFIFGLKNGWNILLPLITGLLFIPTIFMYYNSTAWVYIIGYFIISSLGLFIGKLFRNK